MMRHQRSPSLPPPKWQVYQVLQGSPVPVYTSPACNTTATGLVFYPDDLLSVDRVLDHGNILQLSDGSGYVRLEQTSPESPLRRLNTSVDEQNPNDSSLVVMYVDNYPHGTFLYRHPVDRQDLVFVNDNDNNNNLPISYVPFQKLYCDVHVTHPVSGIVYYHVQGTQGWVYDRQRANANSRMSPTRQRRQVSSPSRSLSSYDRSYNYSSNSDSDDDDDDEDDVYMLLPDSLISVGTFAYMAKEQVEVRSEPDVGENTRTGYIVEAGDIVIGNLIRTSPYHYGNGPFLLVNLGNKGIPTSPQTDDDNDDNAEYGWLFENKHSERIMKSIPVEFGYWKFQVVASPPPLSSSSSLLSTTVAIRKQPIRELYGRRGHVVDTTGNAGVERLLQRNEILECDARIESRKGTYYYRVKGTDGWAPETFPSTGQAVLEVLEEDDGVGTEESPLRESASAASSPGLSTANRSMPSLSKAGSFSKQNGYASWTPDFVRGVAAPIEGLRETAFHPEKHLLSFHNDLHDTDIHVDYSTRTVVTEEPQAQSPLFKDASIASMDRLTHHDCDVKQLASIFKNMWLPVKATHAEKPMNGYADPLAPPTHRTSSSGRSRNLGPSPRNSQTCAPVFKANGHANPLNPFHDLDEEVELRKNLLQAEKEVAQAKEWQVRLLEAVQNLDEQNAQEAAHRFGRNLPTNDTMDRVGRSLPSSPVRPSTTPGNAPNSVGRSPTRSIMQRSFPTAEELNRVCGVCEMEFQTARARSKHCLSEHGMFSCNYCRAVFESKAELVEHRDDEEHW